MKTRILIEKVDITTLSEDAIVNAANEQLAEGGGVCGAIFAAAGPRLKEACRKIKKCPTGQVRLTPGFDLPAKNIIHAVGPVWRGGDKREAEMLKTVYCRSLRLGAKEGFKTLAFPAISTGIYAYPLYQATRIALGITLRFLREEKHTYQRIIFACYNDRAFKAYRQLYRDYSEVKEQVDSGREQLLHRSLANEVWSDKEPARGDVQALNLNIQGVVQGVYFRASTRHAASNYDVNGWVKNEENGSVTIHAEGRDDRLSAFVSWCRKGPLLAVVDKIDIQNATVRGFSRFVIKT